MGIVRLSGVLRCRDVDEAARVRGALDEHVRLTRAEPGCLRFDVCATDDPLVWTVDESFATQSDFDAHQTRMQTSAWARVTAGIERDYSVIEGN